MPKTPINPDNKPVDPSKFPKLKFTKGEKGRVLLLDMEPETNWVHKLEMPKIEEEKILTVVDTRGNTVYDMQWKGNPICLGDFDTVTDKGSDPDGCPACAAHREHGDMFEPPKRRYALPIIQYMTSHDGKLVSPFMCRVVVWAFTDLVFGQLCDLQDEWGDLKVHDLNLGPCDNPTYQQSDINIAGEAKWLESEETKALTATVWKEQQPANLVALCGRESRADWINNDIEDIKKRWAEIRQLEGRGDRVTTTTVDVPVAAMQTEQAIAAVVPEVPSTGALDLEALMAGTPSPEPIQTPTALVTEVGNEGVGTGDKVDLDAILSDMK